MLRLLFLTLFLLHLVLSTSIAQDNTSTSAPVYDLPIQAFTKFPILFGMRVENRLTHNKNFFTSENKNIVLPYEKGRQYNIFGTIPFLRTQNHWYGRVDAAYYYQQAHYGVPLSNDYIFADELNVTGSYASLAAGLTKVLAIKGWDKRLIFSGRFSIKGRGFSRLGNATGLFTTNILWKNTERTTLSFGLTAIIKKNSRLPVIPTISWNQKLSPHWNLEMLLPLNARLRYVQSAQSAIVGGFRLGTNSPFINNDWTAYQDYDKILQFHNLTTRFFVGGEYALNTLFWLHAEAGYNHTYQAALTELDPLIKGLLLRGGSFGNMYVQVGIFIRPVYGAKK